MNKAHVYIEISDSRNTQLALDGAKFIDQTLRAWSMDRHCVGNVYLVQTDYRADAGEFSVTLDSFPNTAAAMTEVANQWFSDQLADRLRRSELRQDKARKAAAARWGNGGDQ